MNSPSDAEVEKLCRRVGKHPTDVKAETTVMKPNLKRLSIILIAAYMSMVEIANAFYDPGLQRWITRDPIQERGGINLFTVVKNDTLNQTDAYGKCPALLPWFIGGFIWGAVMTPDVANAPAPGDRTFGTSIGDRIAGGIVGGTLSMGFGAARGGGLSPRNSVSVTSESLPPGFTQVGPNTWIGTIEINVPSSLPGRGWLGPPPSTWGRPIGPPPPPPPPSGPLGPWSCN
jgi:hypothetical protein